MNPIESPAEKSLAQAKRRTTQRRRARGAVAVEYAFLLVAIAVPVMAAIAAGGITLIREYGRIRNTILHVGP